MEIYRQTSNTVSFELPDGVTNVTATAALDGGTPVPLTAVDPNATPIRKFTLPYIENEGTVKVFYTFTASTFTGSRQVTIEDTYDVVTPILSDVEIKAIHPLATENEIVRIEKAVRHVINAHTGQRFGRFVGVYSVSGSDNLVLTLPSRLLTLNQVNGSPAGTYFRVEGDGYLLRHYPWGVPPVKADYYGLHQHVGGVIHNPNNVKLGEFYKSMVYAVNGIWGWEEVPAPVREAAKLLVNDYACADNAYRDRYLTSMTAADWRIQFNGLAWEGTGNARADELLRPFKKLHGWVV